ncbi:MAG TPA: hypothetical protein VFS55_03500, partial [Dokdonella sp.]|nr:hypothetical protein [Dokdonella sp.]
MAELRFGFVEQAAVEQRAREHEAGAGRVRALAYRAARGAHGGIVLAVLPKGDRETEFGFAIVRRSRDRFVESRNRGFDALRREQGL